MSSNLEDTMPSKLPHGMGSVIFHKPTGRYRATTCSGGKHKTLGYFITRQDAEMAVLDRAHDNIEDSLMLCTQLYYEAMTRVNLNDLDDIEPSYIPYGMGSVTYVDGPRIKRYRARFGSGKGTRNVGYFATRQEAEQAVLRVAMDDLKGKLELCQELFMEVSKSQIYPPL